MGGADGGLRALNLNYDGSKHGIFTDRVGVLTNDFFTELTNTEYEWKKADPAGMSFTLNERASGQTKYTATRPTSSSARTRSSAPWPRSMRVHGHARFVRDFVKVWDKVMNLDRFDLKQ